MMVSAKAGKGLFDLMVASAQAQQAMWTTLSLRVPQLMTGTMSPSEQHRMVSEKVEALAESIGATGAALNNAAIAAAFGGCTPMETMNTMIAVSKAAATPYHRRVTANAKRLKF